MSKLNCWEFKKCGREPGGRNASVAGICPAASVAHANACNSGINGGRICWAISGTFAEDRVNGSLARDLVSCTNCDFFNMVEREERSDRYELILPETLQRFKKGNVNWRCTYVERRRTNRLPADIEAGITFTDLHYKGKVLNISERGMLINSQDICFPPESELSLTIPLSKPCDLPVRVSRISMVSDSSYNLYVELKESSRPYSAFVKKLRNVLAIPERFIRDS